MTWAGQASESGFLTYDSGRIFWTDVDSLSISSSTSQRTEVVTSGTIVNLDTDSRRVIIRKAVGSPTTINLPSPIVGQEVVIKDGKGDAMVNPIMIVAVSGLLIDGFPIIRLANNYQSATLLCDGAGWNIL